MTAETAQALADSGFRFAARYLVPVRYAWKRLTPAEAAAISSAGLQIISVYETAANRPAGGASFGRTDGEAALREAQTVGQPPGTAIYFAVDYDAKPDDYDEIEAYLRAAASQITGYEAGVYGSYAVIEEMARRSACRHFWQTYAWSRGRKSDKANVYQYRNNVREAGITVDLNESYGHEGWWNTLAAEANPIMSEEDAVKIIAFLQAAWKAATTKTDKDEFHRLANEIRKAAGIPLE